MLVVVVGVLAAVAVMLASAAAASARRLRVVVAAVARCLLVVAAAVARCLRVEAAAVRPDCRQQDHHSCFRQLQLVVGVPGMLAWLARRPPQRPQHLQCWPKQLRQPGLCPPRH